MVVDRRCLVEPTQEEMRLLRKIGTCMPPIHSRLCPAVHAHQDSNWSALVALAPKPPLGNRGRPPSPVVFRGVPLPGPGGPPLRGSLMEDRLEVRPRSLRLPACEPAGPFEDWGREVGASPSSEFATPRPLSFHAIRGWSSKPFSMLATVQLRCPPAPASAPAQAATNGPRLPPDAATATAAAATAVATTTPLAAAQGPPAAPTPVPAPRPAVVELAADASGGVDCGRLGGGRMSVVEMWKSLIPHTDSLRAPPPTSSLLAVDSSDAVPSRASPEAPSSPASAAAASGLSEALEVFRVSPPKKSEEQRLRGASGKEIIMQEDEARCAAEVAGTSSLRLGGTAATFAVPANSSNRGDRSADGIDGATVGASVPAAATGAGTGFGACLPGPLPKRGGGRRAGELAEDEEEAAPRERGSNAPGPP
mmetsp:Transcript_108943/g.347835  ORF Transcript_108943/g.347835 Transcript_108943/m.347835 type:complete len:422 (+) Transcript_108943:171-1436(+)